MKNDHGKILFFPHYDDNGGGGELQTSSKGNYGGKIRFPSQRYRF